jgi:hypothetical protein
LHTHIKSDAKDQQPNGEPTAQRKLKPAARSLAQDAAGLVSTKAVLLHNNVSAPGYEMATESLVELAEHASPDAMQFLQDRRLRPAGG